jgi:hypothetical protein
MLIKQKNWMKQILEAKDHQTRDDQGKDSNKDRTWNWYTKASMLKEQDCLELLTD